MNKLHLKITTPERVLIEEEVSEIVIPTKSGQITVMPSHVPLISEIVSGEMIIRNDKDEKIALVFGGFLHVKDNNEVIVLADSAEHIHEVNEVEAEKARKRAEDLINEVRNDKERFAEAEAELARNLTRLRAVKKFRAHKKH